MPAALPRKAAPEPTSSHLHKAMMRASDETLSMTMPPPMGGHVIKPLVESLEKDVSACDVVLADMLRAAESNDVATLHRMVGPLEDALIKLDAVRQTRIDDLEAATIITGELEDKVFRAPSDLTNAIAAARHDERQREADLLIRLKSGIENDTIALENCYTERAKALDECDRLRADVARLHARRSGLANAVNNTLGSRIDLQLECRKLTTDRRVLEDKDESRRGDLRRIEAEVERMRKEAEADAQKNAQELDEQRKKKEAVFQKSSEVRGKVIKTRQTVIRQTRELKQAQTILDRYLAGNAELTELLAEFEPGFSERILQRCAELRLEVKNTNAHLTQARADRDTHVEKCDAETAHVINVKKKNALAERTRVQRKMRQLKTEGEQVHHEEQETKRVYEGLKKSMIEAKDEIKILNTKLMHAEQKCSSLEEELDAVVQEHAANTNTVKENIISLERNCVALSKVAEKKEEMVRQLGIDERQHQERLREKEHQAHSRVTHTLTEATMLREAKKNADVHAEQEREAEKRSAILEKKIAQDRADLRAEEEAFVIQHKLNMKSAEERIYPARAAGYKARKELEKIESQVNSIQATHATFEQGVERRLQRRGDLEKEHGSLTLQKESALDRKQQAREMLEASQIQCRTALADVANERATVQLELDIEEVRHGIGRLLNDRLVAKHTKVYNDVFKYRSQLEPLERALDAAKKDHVAMKSKLDSTYIEIRSNHDSFLTKVASDTEAEHQRYADQTKRARSYIYIKKRLAAEGEALDMTLRRAAEIKFERQ
eukprot:m.72629 g.72629  ORF g.72629 m.72629 type:complete len:782 (-) comp8794_c0_seq1:507-2852(-)